MDGVSSDEKVDKRGSRNARVRVDAPRFATAGSIRMRGKTTGRTGENSTTPRDDVPPAGRGGRLARFRRVINFRLCLVSV